MIALEVGRWRTPPKPAPAPAPNPPPPPRLAETVRLLRLVEAAAERAGRPPTLRNAPVRASCPYTKEGG